MIDLVVQALRKCNAYEIHECNLHIFVLGRFCWSYNPKSKQWFIKSVKKSTALHDYLEHLKDCALDLDYRAYLEASEWANFLKSGRYTRQYGRKMAS